MRNTNTAASSPAPPLAPDVQRWAQPLVAPACRRARLRRRAIGACGLALLCAIGCGEAGTVDGAVTGDIACDAIAAVFDTTLDGAVVGVGRAGGGCGVAVVALADRWLAMTATGTTCATGAWPQGFVAARARTLADAGLLVTDTTGLRVRRLRQQADAPWLAIDQARAATEIVDADESPCGERYALVETAAGTELRRVDADGAAIWTMHGELTSIAATCGGVYVSGQTSAPPDPNGYTNRTGWLARHGGDGAELWRKVYPSDKDLRLVDVRPLGQGIAVHVVQWNLGFYLMDQWLEILDGQGAWIASRPLPGRSSGGNGHSIEDSLAPQPWPAGAVGWVMVSGYSHPGGACGMWTRIEARRADGEADFVRELHEGAATGWVVLDDGSALIGGEGACQTYGTGWLLRMPRCR